MAAAPDRAVLARALANALDCATYASRQRRDWAGCLALLEEIEEVEKGVGESRYSRYRTRFNRYLPLTKLGRLGEAQALLEACLVVYREADDLEMQSNALSGLADVRDKRGDARQATALERQALSVANRLPGPLERGISHGNLARYLTKIAGAKTARAAVLREEERGHRLAAGCYYLLLERWDHLETWLGNLRIYRAWAAENGEEYVLPRLAELLALPAFEPLARFMAGRGVTVEQLQGALDEVIERA
ncbi:MAG: hypothetical protein BECKG1743D_GA0114223_107442 [Candidatus Kentron sp. G]|nr:MAG: hypothetical protein BECKG1743F_GA0114225_102442 [Candidatus Kentron sp. G]VFM98662.1 MAG: hypothetical protein BECKG1743E_GA0114224_102012 [Candidatus Kentron sp. G]VFN05612.1 MAG: hypothetical protein BECKG1743D_GA0114223_107442 [Candidatus Kentron sp. G]